MEKIFKYIPYVAIVILVILLINTCNKAKEDRKESESLITALSDTISHYKNKDGDNVATIATLRLESAKDFINLQLKDSELVDLQRVVTNYKSKLKQAGSSVTNFTATTAVSDSGKTTVTPRDTVIRDNITYVYPEYSDSTINAWIDLKMRMNKDSSHFTLKLTDKYSVIIGEEGRLFRKKKAFADIISYSPYSTVTKMRVYQTAPFKPKKFGLGLSAGVTLNSNLKIAPYVGLGINYSLIRF